MPRSMNEPDRVPFDSPLAPAPRTWMLAWWGLIPTFVFVLVLGATSFPNAADGVAGEAEFKRFFQMAIYALLPSFVIAWVVFRATGRKQRIATVVYSILVAVAGGYVIPRAVNGPDANAEAAEPPLAGQRLTHPDHPIVVTVPNEWNQVGDLEKPLLIVAKDPATGNSLSLLGFKVEDADHELNREAVERGLLVQLGPSGKILNRIDTQLLGERAYCLIAVAKHDDALVSVARIMSEKPLDGYTYVVQYSQVKSGAIDPRSIPGIARRVQKKKH